MNTVRLMTLVILSIFALTSAPTAFHSRILDTLSSGVGINSRAAATTRNWDDGYAEGQVVVKIKNRADENAIAARYGMTVLRRLDNHRNNGNKTFLFGLPSTMTVMQALTVLKADRDVVKAEPNYKFHIPELFGINQSTIGFIEGGEGAYTGQSALYVIQAAAAQVVTNGSGVKVAVIDTGVDLSHPALAGKLLSGFDYADNDPDPSEVSGPAYGHGTMVAGMVLVVAPGARVIPVRAFKQDGYGLASDVAQAILFAVGQGAHIINMSFSFGDEQGPEVVRDAVATAYNAGVVLVGAAGNNGSISPRYPASDVDQVMAVAATDMLDFKASFSNYGTHVDVSAPGVGVYGPFPGGTYAYGDGTSYSAPLVSGVAALVIASRPGDPVSIIRNTAVNINALNPGFSGLLGTGRIDALAAVSQ